MPSEKPRRGRSCSFIPDSLNSVGISLLRSVTRTLASIGPAAGSTRGNAARACSAGLAPFMQGSVSREDRHSTLLHGTHPHRGRKPY